MTSAPTEDERTATISNDGPEDGAEVVALCRRVAEKFRARAADYDRDGRFPVENFADLKAAGLLGIMVPKEHGGLGASFATYTRSLEQLAMGDAATALTYNMHNIAVGSLAELEIDGIGGSMARRMRAFRDWVFAEAVSGQKVFASASSEPGIGAHFSKFRTTYRRVEGGYVIDGAKSFVSMAGHADYYVVAARAADVESEVPALSYLVVEHDNPNISFEYVWDTLGMRATSTNPMTIDGAFVPKERLFGGSEGMALYKIAKEPHWLVGGYNGVYLGIASAAFALMITLLGKKTLPGTDTPLSKDKHIQHRVGELSAALRSARLVTMHAARLVDERRGTPEANEAIHHAKYVVSELGPWLTSHAIRLCGASAITRALPLERYYRDARCGGLMPATSDECLAYLGNAAFGVDLSKPDATYW